MYRLIFILLSIIVFSACRSDKQKDDFSFSGIKIARYDRLQYEATVQNSFFSLQRMNTEFSQETRLLIEEVLDLGSVDMVDMNDRLCAYFSDSILVHLMEDVGEKFKDVSNLEQHLTQGFSNLKKEIHELPVPQIYTQISALNQSVVVGDSILGISLDKYMGSDYPLYKKYYYANQRRSMSPEYIVPDCFTFYLLGQYPFLWQEGHTAHATREEAEAEAQKMLHVYGDFAEKYMAVPVIKGVKSANERFAGALDTYTIEGLMQDGKALQCGTSHFLGQNFAKAFNVQFVDKNNKLDYVWATSWGVSTRLMGALIMTHSDDNGLVLPPHLAPIQVVIVPIYKNDEQLKQIDAKVEGIVNKLRSMGISVKYDNADNKRPGFKFADYELKGVPVRLVMGGRDLENNTMEIMRRDTLEKETRSCDGIEEYVQNLLEEIQQNIYQKALNYRNEHIYKVDTYEEFKEQIEKGGFILAHWDGTPETEDRIKEETKATIRCLPFEADEESLTPGVDMLTGKPSARRVLFARAY